VEYTVAFVLIATLLGSLLDFSLNLVPARIRRKLPPSTGLYFIIGLAIAAVVDGGNYAGFIDAIENLDPDVVLYALLPPLLANFSLHMDMQVFRKVLPQAIFLASAGVIFQILLIGFFFSLVFTAYGWTFIQGMLLGSMLAATDPVAVISILHELGAPKRISTILEGESLLNDGSAFVLFLLIKDASTGRISSFWDVLLRFCDLTLGGPAWGIVMAGIGHFWLSLCHNHTTIETFIPLIGSFATFYSAEKLGVSGVLATVVFGLYMGAKGKYSISPESAKSVDHVLDEVSYLCNMLLFILAGVIVFFHIDDTVGSEAAWVLWIYLIAMYFLLFVFRGLMFVVFSPLLKKWGYGMTTKEAVLLTHAGMRGAISLSLGLLLVKDAEFYAEYPDFAHAVNFLVSGTVCLTLVINGATVDFLYSALELYPPNPHRGTIFQNTMDLLENESMPVVIRKLRTSDHFFQLSNWKAVKKILPKFSTTMLDGVELLWPEGGDTDVIDVLESMITRKGVFNVELEGE
jgi:sodium/hydrogen exchanger 10/11